ncbi:hydantoinase/oxoprolinase family protein [Deferrisoma camini]|uniref:hydantoinase/oxoprolinase family protein n=1 Tax=Deferrisoma camini TaxID=1035120 RepID=UPI00046CE218|nr:hydantoinase/oxoprolinase family protein [Deferrisoma camini]
MTYKIGIDVGGTFTDFLLTEEDGTSHIYKVLSTPKDPSIATIQGIEEMARDRGLTTEEFLGQVSTIVHGTTVTTNATLTYTGAKTGLLTTKGFRDALEMRRGIREEQYNNRFPNARPVVERYLRLPVAERVDYKGDVVEPLDEGSVRAALAEFRNEGVEAVAICFMNAFANPAHERRAAEIVRDELPGAFLSVSTEVVPAIRFYDRVSTTALNAYVGPVLTRYLQSLIRKLEGLRYQGILLIMASNGGVISPEAAMDKPATTLLSGPAGGPVAGLAFVRGQGYEDCITCDMGGTSFDVALVKDGKPLTTTEGSINRLRISLPMLNVVTIGAGGGSIGWIDEGGLLRMGPQSAGADPGPACYGRGGELPTCTDADLVLGYLDPAFFAGGRMPLDLEAARRAIDEHVARKLGYTVEEAAAGMYDVINVSMAAAVREIAVNNGYDPRDFPLVTAGGAGPNHACMIALELGIPVILVPRESSIFCAAGMLRSDLKHDFVRSYPARLDEFDRDRFRALCREMRDEGVRQLAAEGIPEDRVETHVVLDLRYVRQYHEVSVEVPWDEALAADPEAFAARFHPQHDALYGYNLAEKGTPVELINVRVTTVGRTDKPRLAPEPLAGEDPSPAFKRSRSAYLPREKRFADVPVYDGMKLRHGNRIAGPAIIEQVNTTTFVTPEFSVVVDPLGTYTLYLKEREDEILRRVLG